MAKKKTRRSRKSALETLHRIRVKGFKATRDGLEIDVRPLTILAGQNSAGKSSVVQPLLLMKQTLESVHDPGVLELNGPCVKFNKTEQLLWHGKARAKTAESWEVELGLGTRQVMVRYRPRSRARGGGFEVALTREKNERGTASLSSTMTEAARKKAQDVLDPFLIAELSKNSTLEIEAIEDRCAHRLDVWGSTTQDTGGQRILWSTIQPLPIELLESIIHLPGLRGHPERAYPVTRSSGRYPGVFPPYVASVLLGWREDKDPRLAAVGDDLATLGLTWKVEPHPLHDTQVELLVGRLPRPQRGGAHDLVNIADVGFGASQVLPVIVALRAAREGQLVHIEQPELHLHPNAQVAMADLLLGAACRGVRLLVETHSSILLKRIQGQVATRDNGIDPELLALHWFTRTDEGVARVTTAQLEQDGSYGDWPVDFADVEMTVEREFIEAAVARMSEDA